MTNLNLARSISLHLKVEKNYIHPQDDLHSSQLIPVEEQIETYSNLNTRSI